METTEMPVFMIRKHKQDKLQKLDAQRYSEEKELQELIQNNLSVAFGLDMIASEYQIADGRIDTLAVDLSDYPVLYPVIIEYKRNRSKGRGAGFAINQAISYMISLKEQKKEFFHKLIMDKLGSEKYKNITLDWKTHRVICIAYEFDKDEIKLANYMTKTIKAYIELIKYRRYGNDILALEIVSESVNRPTIVNIEEQRDVLETFDWISHHVSNAGDLEKLLYSELRDRIFSLDGDISERGTKIYVGYKLSLYFANIHFQQGKLKIYLRPIDYFDPKNMVEKLSNKYRWTLNRCITITNEEELDSAFELIRQSYENVL